MTRSTERSNPLPHVIVWFVARLALQIGTERITKFFFFFENLLNYIYICYDKLDFMISLSHMKEIESKTNQVSFRTRTNYLYAERKTLC